MVTQAMSIERRDELLTKLQANTISRAEALELEDIAATEYKKAWEYSDALRIIAWMLCRAMLASRLAVVRK